MRSWLTPVLMLTLAGSLSAEGPRLEAIFNGKDLTGWKADDDQVLWRAEAGTLVGENAGGGKGNYLWTERNYGDFVLEFEVRWSGEIDSGVEMRVPHLQMQLGISRSLKRDMTGSFYIGKPGYPDAGQAKTAAQLMHPAGEWNTFRLEAKGSTFKVWINGQPASQYTDETFKGAGPLGLQLHSGVKMKVEYRNIRAAGI
jgi:hypothetical protein